MLLHEKAQIIAQKVKNVISIKVIAAREKDELNKQLRENIDIMRKCEAERMRFCKLAKLEFNLTNFTVTRRLRREELIYGMWFTKIAARC